MTTEHPITPPPELVQQWHESWYDLKVKHIGCDDHIATQAARWGADQELEACVEWLIEQGWFGSSNFGAHELREARRPKPPSLAEQALVALEDGDLGPGASLTPVEVCIIRRALERLQELEKGNGNV